MNHQRPIFTPQNDDQREFYFGTMEESKEESELSSSRMSFLNDSVIPSISNLSMGELTYVSKKITIPHPFLVNPDNSHRDKTISVKCKGL
jgi:hypothetical protein